MLVDAGGPTLELGAVCTVQGCSRQLLGTPGAGKYRLSVQMVRASRQFTAALERTATQLAEVLGQWEEAQRKQRVERETLKRAERLASNFAFTSAANAQQLSDELAARAALERRQSRA